MLNNKLKKIALALAVAVGTSFASPIMAKSIVNTGDILALGSDLTITQKNKLLEYFGAPEDIETIYVTNEIIIEQLGLDPNDQTNYQGGCYSSAFVKLLNDDSGINVEASNLTEVTDSMLMNALITSGIINADVKVSAPFPVTGTSALAGILEGVETIGGYEISLKQKETAQKEIETTMDVAEEIGDEEASSLINDIKTEVIKESPKTEEEVAEIVEKVTNEYNINISIDARDSIVNLMNDVNDLDLDYSELKDSLKDASNKFKDALDELGIKLKNEGFLDKVKNFFSGLWDKITGLFNNDSAEEADEQNIEDEVIEESNESMIIENEETGIEESVEDTSVLSNDDESSMIQNDNTETSEEGNETVEGAVEEATPTVQE